MKFDYIDLLLISAIVVCGACGYRQTRVNQTPSAAAMSQASEEISHLTAEREHYKAQSAKAHELLTYEMHKRDKIARAEYLKGYIEGRTAVTCVPTWPTDLPQQGPAAERAVQRIGKEPRKLSLPPDSDRGH